MRIFVLILSLLLKNKTKIHITNNIQIKQTVFNFQVKYLAGAFKKLNDKYKNKNKTLYRLIPIKVSIHFFSVKRSELFFSLCCFNIKKYKLCHLSIL